MKLVIEGPLTNKQVDRLIKGGKSVNPTLDVGMFYYHPILNSEWNVLAAERFVKPFRENEADEGNRIRATNLEIQKAFLTHLNSIIKGPLNETYKEMNKVRVRCGKVSCVFSDVALADINLHCISS